MLPVLKKGMRGDAVRLCKALIGHEDGSNSFDAPFEEAVRRWQAARGLRVDGIIGRLSWSALLEDAFGLKSRENGKPKSVEPLDFKQYDPRWAGIVYSSCGNKSQTIRSSGCGPTAMADIVAAVKDSAVTPPVLAEKAVAWGDRTRSSGTAQSFFGHIAKEYGFGAYEKSASLDKLERCLADGGWAVANMGKGYWTGGGHYICIRKIADGYVYANDPASSRRTRQKTEQFIKERKMFFLFGE